QAGRRGRGQGVQVPQQFAPDVGSHFAVAEALKRTVDLALAGQCQHHHVRFAQGFVRRGGQGGGAAEWLALGRNLVEDRQGQFTGRGGQQVAGRRAAGRAQPDDAHPWRQRPVHGAGTDQVLTIWATGSVACSPCSITSPAARRPVFSSRASATTAPAGLLRRKLMVRLAVTAPAWPVAPTTAAYSARSARPISMGPATMPPRRWWASRAGKMARAVP